MSTTRYCQAGHKFVIDGTMAVGETITVTVTPAEGYTFAGWWDGNTSQTRTITIEECGLTYTALFNSSGPTPPTPPSGPYRICVDAYTIGANNGGTATVNDELCVTIEPGEEVCLQAYPNEGFETAHWNAPNGTAIAYTDRHCLRPTSSGTYTVFFQLKSAPIQKHTITVIANPQNGGAVSGGGQYDDGTSVTITATANSGYTFTNWKKGSQTITTNSSYTFTVSEDATYTANFTQSAPTLSYRWVSNNDANVIRNSSSYQNGTSSTINLGSSGLYRYTALVVPNSATVSGSYVDSDNDTIQLTFRQESAPFSIDSGLKFVMARTGGEEPRGYRNAIITINQ